MIKETDFGLGNLLESGDL